ncbi:hypothetical protein M441DRAFT_440685 [Trichoderma asperellum CBS 433.97]|uniref:Uncharacterized protein n=1 Tax=Trichoderma asperellum (strain ATCC 204424 / CBS 433.97 / NBRC 101777) TaxID=1042311 RepID=A0A2T3Z4B4_TRIA4|nr:hypothetical protein M441DRAFT_440685 [Trichoderma asperellum CBS 433.97]PTB39590.1 hypothetical protein M441DRAFT_440685 [Trichoderma asperellum CBS 433.97]
MLKEAEATYYFCELCLYCFFFLFCFFLSFSVLWRDGGCTACPSRGSCPFPTTDRRMSGTDWYVDTGFDRRNQHSINIHCMK